jgi:hypothetical protein
VSKPNQQHLNVQKKILQGETLHSLTIIKKGSDSLERRDTSGAIIWFWWPNATLA